LAKLLSMLLPLRIARQQKLDLLQFKLNERH
jgi:hypothetical protein